jgi:hypothetical protein
MELAAPDTAFDIVMDDHGRDGHAFGRPPGLDPGRWPRSRVNGLPMAHLFTVLVPPQFRCAGPDLVALSAFQADDHVATVVTGVAEVLAGGSPPGHDLGAVPFWAALAAYAGDRHPHELYVEDEIGGGWAWVWRSGAEFAGAPCQLPDDAARLPRYTTFDGADAWRADQPARPLRLEARVDDPNVGRRIEDLAPDQVVAGWEHSGYIDTYSEEGERLGLDRFAGRDHFGGTAEPVNGGAAGDGSEATSDGGWAWVPMSPFFLAFDEKLGNPNLGCDGVLQLDLATGRVRWSCG